MHGRPLFHRDDRREAASSATRRPVAGRRFGNDAAGAAAAEFAIVAPLFIFLLMGMIAYGIYLGASHAVQQIAADAARTAIAGLDEAERRQLAQRFVAANAAKYSFIDVAKLHLVVRDDPADLNQFVVRIEYDADDLPIWSLLTSLPLPATKIARTSTIRVGGI